MISRGSLKDDEPTSHIGNSTSAASTTSEITRNNRAGKTALHFGDSFGARRSISRIARPIIIRLATTDIAAAIAHPVGLERGLVDEHRQRLARFRPGPPAVSSQMMSKTLKEKQRPHHGEHQQRRLQATAM